VSLLRHWQGMAGKKSSEDLEGNKPPHAPDQDLAKSQRLSVRVNGLLRAHLGLVSLCA